MNQSFLEKGKTRANKNMVATFIQRLVHLLDKKIKTDLVKLSMAT